MKAHEMVSKVCQFLDRPKEVYVKILHRDQHGCVVAVETYPVQRVFSHHPKEVTIDCERVDRMVSRE